MRDGHPSGTYRCIRVSVQGTGVPHIAGGFHGLDDRHDLSHELVPVLPLHPVHLLRVGPFQTDHVRDNGDDVRCGAGIDSLVDLQVLGVVLNLVTERKDGAEREI